MSLQKKANEMMIMECKYKNMAGVPVDVKVPLYIHSRFQDVLDNGLMQLPFTEFKGWIVTNSRFTEDAISFSKCKEIHLLSWDYPLQSSLKKRIDDLNLYPITCLTTITNNEKKWFLSKNIVLVKDIVEKENILTKAGINSKRKSKILDEAINLINTQNCI